MEYINYSDNVGPYTLEIPDVDMTSWKEVLRRARAGSREITYQREKDPEINRDWHRLNNFEYQHFYSAWVAVVYRFKACTTHSQNFTEAFQRTGGVSRDLEILYQEDDPLFDFFVKGLSVLESFCYSLYALGALIQTPTQTSNDPPPDQFPLLDPKRPKKLMDITPKETLNAFIREFPNLPITEYLGSLLRDRRYKEWKKIRNILTHRVATAGRTIQYPGSFPLQLDESPISVRQWGGDLLLDATMTVSGYDWLRKTINSALEQTATFTIQQLVYTEDQLRQLMW